MLPSGPHASPQRSSARTAGLMGVLVVSVALTSLCTIQILRAALWPEVEPTPHTCQSGLAHLYEAIQGARLAASAELGGERAALAMYRSKIETQWRAYPDVFQKCRALGDASASRALRQVELLRYAEERAIRYEALDLSRLRKTTPQALALLKTENQAGKLP